MRQRILLSLIVCVFLLQTSLSAQVQRIEPPHWWVGFERTELQLLLYGENLQEYQISLDHPGVELVKVHQAHSPNYLFVDLKIAVDAQVGDLRFELRPPKGRKRILKYPLLQRQRPKETYRGFDSSDAVYLITPDRFANARPQNDQINGMREQGVDRSNDYARHGGDIAGIQQHLHYVEEMGFTALWSSPLLENDMPEQSYHGYAITDYYGLDPRFGTLEEYKALARESRERGIKLIMDQVANHCGRYHWWMSDLPFSDWVNHQEHFEAGERLPNSNHRRTVHQDLYASEIDSKGMTEGWFVDAMPDLNQRNPYLAEYLIQNSIWWIETLQLGGIRQDTYPYPDKQFMSEWAGRIRKEYPFFSIVGEEWSYNPLLVGYWQEGAQNKDGYQSNLPSSMDFPLQKALSEALSEPENWNTGLIKLYEGLANDFHYPDPQKLFLFADNHDMDRIATQLKEDPALVRMAMAFLLVSPRIPQIYYGTEIGMQNSAKPGDHGLIRTDFPGGWEGDLKNAFTGQGLSEEEMAMQTYLKKLLQFRKSSKAIHAGKTKHFAPEQGTYVLFRYTEEEALMLVLNKNQGSHELEISRYAEMGWGAGTYTDVLSGQTQLVERTLSLPPKSASLFIYKPL
jgi:glycosidase